MSSSPKFRVDERVYSIGYRRHGRVVAHTPIGGECYYRVDLGTGVPVTLSERDLQPARSPLDRLAAGDCGYASDFNLLTQATALSFAYRYEGLSCLSNSRLDPKPYQIFVAHRVLQDLYPRYLLADEVGLGKTIEAGLILKELKARGLAERVLIVVPASLCEQWQGELATKFNEQFHIYNSGTVRENLRRNPRSNPWERDSYIITSLQFARQQTSQLNRPTNGRQRDEAQANHWIDEVDWDLVIFDEAHHLRRYLKGRNLDSSHEITKSYQLGQALASQAKSLLLVTATPLQLSRYETYSLVELLDPSLFSSYDNFVNHMSLNWNPLFEVAELLRKHDFDKHQEEMLSLLIPGLRQFQRLGLDPEFWCNLTDCLLEAASSGQWGMVQADVEQLRDALGQFERDSTAYESMEKSIGTWGEEWHLALSNLWKKTQERFEMYLAQFVFKYREGLGSWFECQHKLSQVMIRNRKREVLKGEFVERRAYKVQVNLTTQERALYNTVSAYIKSAYARVTGQTMALGFVLTIFRKLLVSSPHALAASLERRASRIETALQGEPPEAGSFNQDDLEERAETLESVEQLEDLFSLIGDLSPEEAQAEIVTLRNLAIRARSLPIDSKANKLLAAAQSILNADPTEKVLVFTQFRETQTYLQSLFEQAGYQVALFHGEYGSSGYSKRAEFERFKKDPAVRVMLSTEVGGEGLNFQFCHVMFNYDLPWNPMRIEQRIGRLDRIGQKRDVHIYNFFLEGTLDARILTVLQDRIRLFEETIGNLDPILGEDIERDIEAITLSDEAEAEQKLADFEELAERRVREAREAEAQMVDFIMDTRSFRRDTVDEILGRKPPISHREIEAFTRAFLGRYPQDDLFKPGGDNVYTVTVPPRFREDCKQLYGIYLQEKYKGTFDPKTAIEEDTIDFFAFGHPLFDAIIRYCTDYEGNNLFDAQTASRVLHHADHAGYTGLQFNYVLSLNGVRPHKKLIPVVLDLSGAYDEKLSRLVFSLPADEEATISTGVPLSASILQDLEERSHAIVGQIAGQEMEEARKRNARDYAEMQEKLMHLFDYRLRNQQIELEQRQARLEDAKQKGQKRILPALEGQVHATQRRISELEQQRNSQLVELQTQQDASLSIELLNVAYVRIV